MEKKNFPWTSLGTGLAENKGWGVNNPCERLGRTGQYAYSFRVCRKRWKVEYVNEQRRSISFKQGRITYRKALDENKTRNFRDS